MVASAGQVKTARGRGCVSSDGAISRWSRAECEQGVTGRDRAWLGLNRGGVAVVKTASRDGFDGGRVRDGRVQQTRPPKVVVKMEWLGQRSCVSGQGPGGTYSLREHVADQSDAGRVTMPAHEVLVVPKGRVRRRTRDVGQVVHELLRHAVVLMRHSGEATSKGDQRDTWARSGHAFT